MGLFSKLFGLTVRCPECGTPGAKDGFAGVKCQRTGCRFYDPVYVTHVRRTDESSWQGAPPVSFERPVRIEYENFRGERRIFVGEARSIRVRNAHLSVAVQPTGRRIALKAEKIANLQEIRNSMPTGPAPTSREAYVLAFHRRRGSTSPLYEELGKKYPDY